jgi:hypothetical protein
MAENVQNLNQFAQTPIVGQPDWSVNQNIVPVKIYASSAGGALLVAGQAFKFVDVAGDMPVVDLVSAVTDKADGVAIHRMKGDTFVAGQIIELALVGSTIWMQFSAAAARGASLQLDPAGPTVATLASLGTNVSIGKSIDKPGAANAMGRVYINPADANLSAY